MFEKIGNVELSYIKVNKDEPNEEATDGKRDSEDTLSDEEINISDDNNDNKANEQALRYAIRSRDLPAVKQLLADGVSLTCRDNLEMTPLLLCIRQFCYWNFENNIPGTECLPVEMEIIQEILAAANRSKNKRDILDSLDRYGRSALYLAIDCGYFEVVKVLVKSGTSIETISDDNETALHISVQRPYILKYFLENHQFENSFDNNGYAAVHTAARCNEVESLEVLLNQFGYKQLTYRTANGSTVLHIAAEYNSEQIANFLLKGRFRTVYRVELQVDNEGETPLNRAAKNGHKALTALLLNHGSVLSHKGFQGITAVKQITRFANPLQFFEDVFDECIIENYSALSEERHVRVDYKVLANGDGNGMSQIKVIEELVKCGQRELLLHPLIESLLYLKWKCLLPVVYTIIAIYATFLVSFNVFLVTVFYGRDYNTSHWKTSLNETEAPSLKCYDGWSDWLWIVLIYLSICLMFGQECVYIYRQWRRYFVHLESWVKLCLLALAAAVVPGLHCGAPEPWLRHLACAALLLSWLQAMLLLSRFPDWGYYVLMFERVAYNIFKILLTSICLVIGFSLCFMIEPPFDGPWAAFVKTLVMMSSEFDYEDLFGEDHNGELQATKPVVRLLFVMFVIFIAIVLMNFMIGIAVSDINKLNVIGNIRRLEKQVELQSTLDVLIDSALAKLYKRLLRIKFHHSISKNIESDEKWNVWFGIYKCGVHDYKQSLTSKLQNAIINVARKKTQMQKDDHTRSDKQNKLDAIYNTLIGMPYHSEREGQENVSNSSINGLKLKNDITLKETIKSLKQSNEVMKESIHDLKESLSLIIEIMANEYLRTNRNKVVQRRGDITK